MKIIIAISILFSIVSETKAQKEQVNFCSYSVSTKDADLCKTISWTTLSSNMEAEKAIDKIIAPLGLKRNFILVPCTQIKNCAAATVGGLRYIVYDNDFLNEIQNSSKNSWASLSILAHEIGHHLNGHTLVHKYKAEQRQEELEADEFSGFILYKLGATLFDAQVAINSIEHPSCISEDNYDHPCKEKRLNAIKDGWEKAKSQGNSSKSDATKSNVKTEKEFYDEAIDAYNNKNYFLTKKIAENYIAAYPEKPQGYYFNVKAARGIDADATLGTAVLPILQQNSFLSNQIEILMKAPIANKAGIEKNKSTMYGNLCYLMGFYNDIQKDVQKAIDVCDKILFLYPEPISEQNKFATKIKNVLEKSHH